MKEILLLPKALGCQMKRPTSGQGHLPSSCWSETPKIIQDLAIVLGCPSDLDGEALLLKIVYTGHRTWRNQVGTNQEASSPLLAITGLWKKNSHQQFLPRCKPYELQ